VEPLRPHQQRAAALTLAEAFASDPLFEILAPDPARRVKNIAFYRKRGFEIIGQADCYGHTLTGMIRQPRSPAQEHPV